MCWTWSRLPWYGPLSPLAARFLPARWPPSCRRRERLVADLVVRGGTVVTETWSGRATILIADGRIAGIYGPEEQPASGRRRRVVDADGRFVLPGGRSARPRWHAPR